MQGNRVTGLKQRRHDMKQYVVTPAAGKRLIAKGVAAHPAVVNAIQSGTLVIVAGTTNAIVAEEILASMGKSNEINLSRFFRGVTLPPGVTLAGAGTPPDATGFPGDIVISKGEPITGKTIFDVADDLKEGDVILKGANAIDCSRKRAAVLIGHPQGGTVAAAIRCVVGRRVKLIMPVGLEKRICGDIDDIAAMLNEPGGFGARLLPAPGQVFTEIEALSLLTGAQAQLVSAGGVGGAEGSVWLSVRGEPGQEAAAGALMDSLLMEQPFQL